MFRIGGEEDLLDRAPAVPVCAPQPSRAAVPIASRPLPATARAACPPAAGTPWASATPPETSGISEAGVLNMSAPDAPARGSQAPHTDDMEPSPVTVLHAPASPPLSDLDRQDPATAHGRSISQDDMPTVAPPLRRRRLPAHQHRDTATRRHRSTATLKRRPRPRLARLQSCIAWVNALIFTVLVVAAVIGHTPASTTAAGSESSTVVTQVATKPVAPLPSTRFTGSKTLLRPRVRKHRERLSHSQRPRRMLHPGTRSVQGDTPAEFIP